MDAADALPVPAELVAVTVKVYASPLLRPVTVIGELAPVPVKPPGFAVTVYPLIAAPPVFAGAVKVTLASVLPAVAVPMTGAAGTTALTVKVRLICSAAFQALSPS